MKMKVFFVFLLVIPAVFFTAFTSFNAKPGRNTRDIASTALKSDTYTNFSDDKTATEVNPDRDMLAQKAGQTSDKDKMKSDSGAGKDTSARKEEKSEKEAGDKKNPAKSDQQTVKKDKAEDEKNAGNTAGQPEEPEIEDIKPVPFVDFTLPDLEDKSVNSADLRKGKWAIVKFGASWCPPCRIMTEELKKIQKEFSPDKLAIIEISMESKEDALAYHKKTNATWPNLIDANSSVGMKYGASSIPLILLVNKEGMIVFGRPGAVSAENMKAILKHYKFE